MSDTMNALVGDELGSVELTANGMDIRTVGQVAAFARLLGVAGMLPKGVSAAAAVVSIVAGRGLGLDPFQSVQGIASINGRPAIWGDAMLAVVKASGLVEDERVEYLPSHKDCQGVRYTVKRRGVETPFVGEFSRAMAERAGLWGKSGPWSQYPDRMMLARARAFALRDGFADVLRGMRCAEEEGDVVDGDCVQVSAHRRKRASASAILGVMREEQPKALPEGAPGVSDPGTETVKDVPAEIAPLDAPPVRVASHSEDESAPVAAPSIPDYL